MKLEDIKKQAQHRADIAATKRRQELRQKLESNSEYQRKSRMTKEEIAREAIQRSAKGIKEYNDFKTGRDTTMADALKKAEALAHKADIDNGG